MFSFKVEGPRKHYDFSIELIEDIQLGETYQSVLFKLIPYSTYIGIDEEKLILTFLIPEKLVTPYQQNITIANNETSITIYDSSDAVSKDVDITTTTLAYVIGFGTLVSICLSYTLKIMFGIKFNLGWGVINFIQICAFIPLMRMYFPGNIRGFASMLKITNTAGKSGPNLFYLMINRDKLDNRPFNFRFDVMGIDSTVFIENCGTQITIYFIILILLLIMKLINSYTTSKNKYVKSALKMISWVISYNSFFKTVIILYLFLFMSTLLTIRDVNLDNGDQVASYIISLIAFLIFSFIFYIFHYIQKYSSQIINSEEFREKINCFISDIDVKRNLAKYFIPINLLRKATYGTLLVVFGKDVPPELQFVFIVLQALIMLMVVIVLKPFSFLVMNLTAIFNEIMITVIICFSGIFLQRELHNKKAIDLGWTWISLVSFTIISNWFLVIGIQIKDIIMKRAKKKAKVASKKGKAVRMHTRSEIPASSSNINVSSEMIPSASFDSRGKSFKFSELDNKKFCSPLKSIDEMPNFYDENPNFNSDASPHTSNTNSCSPKKSFVSRFDQSVSIEHKFSFREEGKFFTCMF